MNVQRLINLAFLDLNAIASGETPSAAESTDALDLLNHIISGWNSEELMAFEQRHQTFFLTPTVTQYTIGPGGSWATTARPGRVTGATSIFNPFRQGMKVMGFPEFAAATANQTGRSDTLPSLLAVDNGSPLITAQVFPPPAAVATIELHFWLPITAFVALTDVIALPQAYERALRLALAIELYPQYPRSGGIDPVLAANAGAAKKAIQDLNAAILGATTAAAPVPAQ